MNVYSKYSPPGGAGGLFLKLDPDTSVKVRLTSDPYIFNSEYQGTVSTKYAWVVYNYSDEKGQVLQLPVTGFRALKAIAEDPEWGDPQGFDITVNREGSGKETKYHLTPSPNKQPLTKEMKDEVEKVDITKAIKGAIPLEQVISGKEVPPADMKPPTELMDDLDVEVEEGSADEIPF